MKSSLTLVRCRLFFAFLVVVVIAGCGISGNDDPTPTPEPSPTAPLAPGQKTVGDLLNGIEAAWPSVTSARTVFTTTSRNGGTPSPTSAITTEEYLAPDKRRIVMASGNTVLDEQIAIGSAVYLRGTFVVTAVAPMLSVDTWVTVDPSLVPPDTPVGNVISYLTQPFRLPFATISDELRARGVSQIGQMDVAGRSCTVWGFVDTSDFGDRLDYELAIDERGLPCSLVERAGSVENVTTFEFNIPDLAIVAPDSAQPVTGTPEG